MAYVPTNFTNGVATALASTAGEATQLRWEGWWPVGEEAPELSLSDRFAFGPTKPTNPRVGVIYIQTPV
jgi:hypothetical protein